MIAKWMIIIENRCCLSLFGIVLNEQRPRDDLSFIPYIRVSHHVLFKYVTCSFITNPYGRVHPFGCKKGRADSAALPFEVALLFLTRGQGLF